MPRTSKRIGVHGTDSETGRNGTPRKVSSFALSNGDFMAKAKTISLNVMANPMIFSSQKPGFNVNMRASVEIDGIWYPCRISGNVFLS